MEKSKTFLRAAGILMGATMLTTCVLGGTLANFVTEGTGTGSATVANWDIKLNDNALTDTVTCDLFTGTIGDLGTVSSADPMNPDLSAITLTQDKSVAAGKIAPGTWGKQEFKVTNNSDVDAAISIQIEKNAAVTVGSDAEKILNQLKFSTDGKTWSDIDSLVGDTQIIENDAASKDVTVDLYWMWTFDEVVDRPADDGNIDNDYQGLTGTLIDVTISADQSDSRA